MNTGEVKAGIIYCRVSSDEQVKNTSLESQEEQCRAYAKREGIKVLDVFVEKGESAKTADRTEFLKALNFCSKNKKLVDYFIVCKLDRFARNQEDHVTTQGLLKKNGVILKSATEPINETPMGRAMEGMLSVWAELDNNMRTERSINGMKERLKQGAWVWSAPLGYYRPYKGANIVPDEKTAPLIHLAFEEWAKGTYSYESLAEFLADRGLKTSTGKIPSAQLMEKIIKNPIYCGIMRGFEGQEFEGSYDPIISRTLFEECQAGHKKTKVHRSKDNSKFPLRRICFCSACNKPLTASESRGNGGKYAYYHHHKQGCSEARSIPTKEFEKIFVEYLGGITPSKKYEKTFKAIMIDIWQTNYKKLNERSGQVTRDIEKLEKERDKVFELHRSEVYSDEDFLREKNRVNKSIYHQRQLLHDNYVEEFDMEEALDYCFRFVGETAKVWTNMRKENPKRLLRFQNQIFPENIIFDGEKFETNKIALVYKLNQENGDKKSNLVTLRGIEPRFHP